MLPSSENHLYFFKPPHFLTWRLSLGWQWNHNRFFWRAASSAHLAVTLYSLNPVVCRTNLGSVPSQAGAEVAPGVFSCWLLAWEWWLPACRCPTSVLVDVGDVAMAVCKGPQGDGVAQPEWDLGVGCWDVGWSPSMKHGWNPLSGKGCHHDSSNAGLNATRWSAVPEQVSELT